MTRSTSVLFLDDQDLALLDCVLGGTLDLGFVGTTSILQSQGVSVKLDAVDAVAESTHVGYKGISGSIIRGATH